MSSPRVRFAPSPTGYLHVGNARTALFNWLFARQQGGTFVLRIEDTDVDRSRSELIDVILSGLSWLGMQPDEGPVRQSERTDRYDEVIDQLWSDGVLYACDCTRDDVLARTKDNATPGYDGHCRDRGLERNEKTALRFRTPDEGTTLIRDVVRGDVEFPHSALEDFVCVKSTGQPLFVLANAIDDRDTAISHVIRGEDLLPTTPKGVLLWRALDVRDPIELPVFAHLPMLVNEKRQKLSKRRDPVVVDAYRDEGYLAQAFRNYLALLGWSPSGDREKVDLDTLISEFRLEDVHHASAFFDVKKLRHLNGEYIRELSPGAFVAEARPWVAPSDETWSPSNETPPWPADHFDPARFEAIAPAVQERVAVLSEVPGMVDFLFLDDPPDDDKSWDKVAADPATAEILDKAMAAYGDCDWNHDELEAVTRALSESVGKSLRRGQEPIRVAVTGRAVGPPLFESLAVMGRDEVLRRLRGAADRLGTA
ncbi:MAG: glutamate--tRNA ligase [Acidimicrobiales bacterium]